MNGEEFKLAAGIDVMHVPFQGHARGAHQRVRGAVQLFLRAYHGVRCPW